MEYPCFLIVPVLGAQEQSDPRGWPPFNLIEGWRRVDTPLDVRRSTHDFGVGVMWWAIWYPKNFEWDNETEPHLIVRCPTDRDWDIDSRCKNCGLPDDKLHRCWVRHGVAPLITVDKDGLTCDAGAGSIQLPNWHGHLRNGVLVPC